MIETEKKRSDTRPKFKRYVVYVRMIVIMVVSLLLMSESYLLGVVFVVDGSQFEFFYH